MIFIARDSVGWAILDENTTIHRVTYKDNTYLTDSDVAKFERLRIENPKKLVCSNFLLPQE